MSSKVQEPRNEAEYEKQLADLVDNSKAIEGETKGPAVEGDLCWPPVVKEGGRKWTFAEAMEAMTKDDIAAAADARQWIGRYYQNSQRKAIDAPVPKRFVVLDVIKGQPIRTEVEALDPVEAMAKANDKNGWTRGPIGREVRQLSAA